MDRKFLEKSIVFATNMPPEEAEKYIEQNLTHRDNPEQDYPAILDKIKKSVPPKSATETFSTNATEVVEHGSKAGRDYIVEISNAETAAAQAKIKTLEADSTVDQLLYMRDHGFWAPVLDKDGNETKEIAHYSFSAGALGVLNKALTDRAQSSDTIHDLAVNYFHLGQPGEVKPEDLPGAIQNYLQEKGLTNNVDWKVINEGVQQWYSLKSLPHEIRTKILQADIAAVKPAEIAAFSEFYARYKINSDDNHTLLKLTDTPGFINEYQKQNDLLKKIVEQGIDGEVKLRLAGVRLAADVLDAQLKSLNPEQISQLSDIYKKFMGLDASGKPTKTFLDVAADPEFQKAWQVLPALVRTNISESVDVQARMALAKIKLSADTAQAGKQTLEGEAAQETVRQLEEEKRANNGELPAVKEQVLADTKARIADATIKQAQASYADKDAAVQTMILDAILGSTGPDGKLNGEKLTNTIWGRGAQTPSSFGPANTAASVPVSGTAVPGQPIGPAQLGAAVTSVGIDVLLSPNGLPVGTLGARLPRAKLQMGEPDPHILPADRRIIENGERIIRDQPRKTGPEPHH